MRVLVAEPVHPAALALLTGAGCEVVQADGSAAIAALSQVQAVIVRTMILPEAAMTAPLVLVSKHGVGVDNIPLAAARAGGVAVTNTPGANAGAVAEHTLMLMLALAKRLPTMQEAARVGGKIPLGVTVGDLAGQRLLVVGNGQTGRRVAALGAAFGMAVTILTRRGEGHSAEGHSLTQDLHSALVQTDVLSLHCPLTEATRGMIGAAELALLPPGALVINTARGGLIDEAALAEAARTGQIAGFALDVVEEEPIRPGNPLLALPNGIITPHSAGMGIAAFRQMGLDAAQNILDFRAGRLDPRRIVVAPPGR